MHFEANEINPGHLNWAWYETFYFLIASLSRGKYRNCLEGYHVSLFNSIKNQYQLMLHQLSFYYGGECKGVE